MVRHRTLLYVMTCVGLVCLASLVSRSQSALRRITNTTDEGININPTISGDGRIVAFESTEDITGGGGSDGLRAIRANIAVEPATLFQIGRTRAVSPAVSQDGSHIAFASKDDPLGTNADGNSEIFLFNGSNLLQVTNTSPGDPANRVTDGNFQPSISDDGRFVAFSSNRNITSQNSDGNLEILVYDSMAVTFAQLTNSVGNVGCTDAKISGNGVKVAYIRDTGATPSARRDLIIQNRSSSTATVLASQVQSLLLTYGRAISDDGTRVVYAGETAATSTQVFFYDGRGGDVNRQVTSLGTRTTEVPLHATISGDGKRIAFATRRAVTGLSNPDASVELYTYDIPTTSFARVTSAPAEADCFEGSSQACEVVASLNDDGSMIVFNFPRALSGTVPAGLENKSEIYATGTAARQPFGTLNSILNQASLGHEPSATKAVAPDSVVAAFGSALANTTQQSQKLANGTFPTNVAGTTVTVSGRSAQIFFVSPDVVQFLIPPQTEIGNAEVVITNADGFRSRGTLPILRAAPGIFTRTGDGTGEGIILDSDTSQSGPFDPTRGNLRLSIFCTGVRNGLLTTVNLAGRVIAPEWVTPSELPGLDEVTIRVPSDLRGVGTVSLFISSDGRDSNPVTVTFTGDPSRNVLINEVLADPPAGIAGDANHDGIRDGTQDEFVELVNGTSSELINIGGWTIKTKAVGSSTETARFTFAAGTSLPAGEAIVVFGGGTFNPSDPVFGCAQVVKATTSTGLSLTNGGLTILVRDSAGNLITQFSYGGSTGLDGANSQSLARSPDVTGGFMQHTTAASANGHAYSPGLRLNGTPFGDCLGHLTAVTIAPPSATLTVGQTTDFAAQAFDEYGRVMTSGTTSFTSDNTSVGTVESVTMNLSTRVATANVKARNPGTAHIIASATDGAKIVNSSQTTLSVTGPSLSINDLSQNEGDSGTTTFNFTVSLSTPAPSEVTFDVVTQDNTAAIADNDYGARSLTGQIIPAGSQTYTFAVTVNGDVNVEPTETFLVNVSNVSGASVSDAQGVGTIVTDDVPKLRVNDVSLLEGNTGATTFVFTVTSNRPAPSGGITFDIATLNGTAISDTDYLARSLSAQTIPAGQLSYTFEVTENGDTLVESNETFFVNIENVSSNAAIDDAQGQGTILNDDAANLVISQVYGGGNNSGASFRNDFVEIFNRGTTTIDFAVTPYSVQYASVGSNFGSSKTNLSSGTVAPGEYFLVQESGGSVNGAPLPAPDAIGTIALGNTSGKVALIVGINTLTTATCPGNDGSVPFNPGDETIADFVGYGLAAGTSGHCYEGPAPAPASSNTAADLRKFGGCQDTNENPADFVTGIPNPRNSSSAINDCGAADLQITNSDAPDPVTIGSNITYTITVSNNGPASAQSVLVSDNLPAEVTFVSCHATGGAVCGGSANNRSVTHPSLAGAASFTATIVATANGPHNATATNTATVSSETTDANSANNSSTTTTLIQEPTPNLSINDVMLSEGNSGSTTFAFTITLSPASSQHVTVNYATANGTATAGSDYTVIPSTQLTFFPGETVKAINVTVTGDTTIEPEETFTVDLSGATNAHISDSQGVGTIVNDDGTVVVVSQVYGGGGNAGATYNADFVELFNRSTSPVDVTNWSIQYQSAATTSGAAWAINRVCPTGSCAIAAGHYYLVQLGSGGSTGAGLSPDAAPASATNIAAGAGKLALVSNLTAVAGVSGSGCPSPFPTSSIFDFVGYGTGASICFEGAGAASGPPNNATSITRKSSGCQDTNSNLSDFNSPALVTPRNSNAPANTCP